MRERILTDVTSLHECVSIYMVGNERYFIVYYCTDYGLGYLSRYSDSLRAGRSGDRIPVRARLSAPTQTGSCTHLATYTIGAGSLSRG